MKINDIKGIGPAAVSKLKKAELVSVQDIATTSIEYLAEAVGVSKDVANTYIQNAHELLRENGLIAAEYVTGNESLAARKALLRCKTGSSKLDEFLAGGIETGAITELYGQMGSGKSQFCHTLAVNSSKPIENGGLNGPCIYFDTEATFRPERIEMIAQAQELDIEATLNNVKICRIYNSGHLEQMINSLPSSIEEFGAKMVIVDSIIALHRGDYTGRGSLAERQQKINQILHRLLRVSEIYKIAVIITNQITTSPDTFFGDPNKPTGGNIIGHASTYRMYLTKNGKIRKAKMIDSPLHEIGECPFTITVRGIEDIPEE